MIKQKLRNNILKKLCVSLMTGCMIAVSLPASAFAGVTQEATAAEDDQEKEYIEMYSKDALTGEERYYTYELGLSEDELVSTPSYTPPDIIEPYYIIGDDNRITLDASTVQLKPYRMICYIESEFTGATGKKYYYRGTGFVMGPDLVATSGHLLHKYIIDENAYLTCSKVTVMPAKLGSSEPFGSYEAVHWKMPAGWTINHNEDDDWGLIYTAKPIGNVVGWFGMEPATSKGTFVNLTGYPGDKGETMMRSIGYVTQLTDSRITVDCDAMKGNSGSPIYIDYNDQGDFRILGLFSYMYNDYSGNFGPRLAGGLYQNLEASRVQYYLSGPGSVDEIGPGMIRGWGINPNWRYEPIEVHSYIYNDTTNALMTSKAEVAEHYRADVGYHAYYCNIDWGRMPDTTYKIDTYFIYGDHPCITKYYTVKPLTGHTDDVNSSCIRGWVWKPDLPNDPAQAHIYIYKESTGELVTANAYYANAYRWDLEAAGIGNGYHSFEINMDWSSLPKERLRVVTFAYDGISNNQIIGDTIYDNR